MALSLPSPNLCKTGAVTGVRKGGRRQLHSPRTVGKWGVTNLLFMPGWQVVTLQGQRRHSLPTSVIKIGAEWSVNLTDCQELPRSGDTPPTTPTACKEAEMWLIQELFPQALV